MKFGWQSLVGPAFWIAATAAAMSYGPDLILKFQGKPPAKGGAGVNLNNLSQSILGQESESSTGENRPKLPATPQEVPQFVREIIERTTNTVIEKGQTEVEEKKTEVVKSACGQIIAEIEKQCNISTSN